MDLDVDIFVALLEGIVRETPQLAETLDDLYDAAEAEREAAASPPPTRAERNNDIRRVLGLFKG